VGLSSWSARRCSATVELTQNRDGKRPNGNNPERKHMLSLHQLSDELNRDRMARASQRSRASEARRSSPTQQDSRRRRLTGQLIRRLSLIRLGVRERPI